MENLLYPVRDSNAELVLRRDPFYPVKLTRHFAFATINVKARTNIQ